MAVGERDLCAIGRHLTEAGKDAAADALVPQQVAVGVSGGISILIHGVRLLLEFRGDFVVIRMDMSNGYNAVSRSVMLRRLAETPRLAHWVPFIHALSKHATPLVVGMLMQQLFAGARGDSADGTQQGFAPSSTAFSVAIHPELKALDAILKPFGGCARAIMDDVYAVGPASVVFAAVQRFADTLREMTRLEMNVAKYSCWSPAYDLASCPWRRQFGIPLGFVTTRGVQPRGDAGDVVGRGVMVGGVPVGEEAFVTEVIRQEGEAVVSYIEKTLLELRGSDHYGLWACLQYCCQSKFDYMLQHVPPSFTDHDAARIDAALVRVAQQLSYDDVLSDGITMRRFRLPARERGCGVRSRQHLVRHAAYAASFVRAAERFLDTTDAAGNIVPGFFPMLNDVFGAGAFGPGGHRLRDFLPSGRRLRDLLAPAPRRPLPTAVAFEETWALLRARVDGSDVRGALDASAAQAGASTPGKLQHAITSHVERVERGLLHDAITALADADPRKVAWLSCDDISNRWVSAWPTAELEMTDPEFGEVFTTYLGRESPGVRPYAGETVAHVGGQAGPNGRLVVDEFGMNLNLANIPGTGNWTPPHNVLATHIFGLTVEAGFHTEVTPAHYFSSLVPVGVLLAQGGTPGIVPDAGVDVPLPAASTRRGARRASRRREAARRHLFDVKTIYGGGYATIYLCARARQEQTGAVAERAHRVNGAYVGHTRQLDARYGAGAQPFLQRLQSFGPVRGLAAGQYGEVSPDVHSLVAVCAESIASRRWRELGARSAKEACGFVTAAVKRRLGLVLVREMARFRLRRVPAIGVPNAALSGQADLQRRLRRRRSVNEPLDRPPAFVPEEFFAFQAFAAPRAA